MSEKPFALNLFDLLELTDEVPVRPRTPMATRRKMASSDFGSCSAGPIADRLRHRPSQNESLKNVPSAVKLAELTHYDAWFDTGIYHVTLSGVKFRGIIENYIFNILYPNP